MQLTGNCNGHTWSCFPHVPMRKIVQLYYEWQRYYYPRSYVSRSILSVMSVAITRIRACIENDQKMGAREQTTTDMQELVVFFTSDAIHVKLVPDPVRGISVYSVECTPY